MDKQLQEELTKWLAGIRGAAGKASDLVLEQAPEVVHDFIALGRAENTGYMLLAVAVAVFDVWLLRKALAVMKGKEWDWENNPEVVIPAVIFLPGIAIVAAAICGTHFHDFIASWFAPRVYLIESMAKLLRPAS
jgi:hypothetical protein